MDTSSAVVYLLHHLGFVVNQQSDQLLKEQLGIGMSQFKLLVALEQNPAVQQRKLADSLGQTEASISRQIKILIEKGLLTMRINPKSRREHLTMLTAKGTALTEAARDIMQRAFIPLFEGLGEKQTQQLIERLSALHGSMCRPGASTGCTHPYDL